MKNTVALIALACVTLLSTSSQTKADVYVEGDLGFASANYSNSSPLQSFVNAEESNVDSHFGLAFDLAVLLPVVDSTTVVGAGYDGVADYYFQNQGYGNATVSQINLVGTLRHYFSDRVGNGFFIRADAGLAIVSAYTSNDFSDYGDYREAGFDVLGGAGYGFEISPNVTLHAELDYSRIFIPGSPVGTLIPIAGVTVHLGGERYSNRPERYFP